MGLGEIVSSYLDLDTLQYPFFRGTYFHIYIGYWSKFPIIRGPIFVFPLQYGALYKFPPFLEQEFRETFLSICLYICTYPYKHIGVMKHKVRYPKKG